MGVSWVRRAVMRAGDRSSALMSRPMLPRATPSPYLLRRLLRARHADGAPSRRYEPRCAPFVRRRACAHAGTRPLQRPGRQTRPQLHVSASDIPRQERKTNRVERDSSAGERHLRSVPPQLIARHEEPPEPLGGCTSGGQYVSTAGVGL